MTQQAFAPAAPAPPAPPAAPGPITEVQLWEIIFARVSAALKREVRLGQVAMGHMFVFWKGEPLADGSVPARGVTVYERGKPAPIKASLAVLALFGFDDDFVRVYALPTDPAGGDLGPARITLSRTAPVPSAFIEYIPFDAFASEIASEIVNDLGGDADAEDEADEDGDEDEDSEGGAGAGFTAAP